MKISIVAAKAVNGVIGNDADIPWSVKGEQALFKAITHDQTILMGRKTYEAIGGHLPDRINIVVSRVESIDNEFCITCKNIEAAIEAAKTYTDRLYVIGGGEIYKQTIDLADTIHLSLIHAATPGDVYFPEIPDCFEKTYEHLFKSNIDYTYQVFRRNP